VLAATIEHSRPTSLRLTTGKIVLARRPTRHYPETYQEKQRIALVLA
jgi:hypothetical protein